MGKVIAVCISEKKGTQKKRSGRKYVWWKTGGSRLKDALCGKPASAGEALLSFEKIEAFREKGAKSISGAFRENMIIAGV